MLGLLLFSFLILIDAPQSQAQPQPVIETASEDTIRTSMPQIEVIGRPERFQRIPGSANIINFQTIQSVAPVSSNEVFRRITGLHAVEEEGLGLRANIGIRGLDPDKSRTVLMMEDGIPIALAPYGEPEMYYTPSMDRMVGVEILKGSGSILFGPQTFGGVINYLTANPPATPTATVHIRGGEGGYFTGRVGYGTTYGNTGFQATYLRKSGDEVGLLAYDVHDFNTKVKMVLAPNSIVGIKLGFYNESSNSTYVGLTQEMYDTGLYDFLHLSPNDQLDVRRYSASVSHDYYFTDNIRLKTTAFGYTTTRNWGRQDFDNVFNPNRTYDRVVGNPATNFGAIYFRPTTGNRNRQFEVLGFEPRLSANLEIGGIASELDLGFRYLYERAFEQRIDGTPNRPASGTLREDEIRTGVAYSAYIQNRFFITEAFTVTPGLRIEQFNYERDIQRLNNAEVNIVNSSDIIEVIPGLGFNYAFGNNGAVFAGIHRGFGPPRTKDAITAAGISEDLDAERSWNLEAGVRRQISEAFSAELGVFYLYFSNQIIPVSESSGATGNFVTSLTNGGETEHVGVEASFQLNVGQLLNSNTGLLLRSAATYTKATFKSNPFKGDGFSGTASVIGNTLPYAPELLLNTGLDIVLPIGLSFAFDAMYIGDQFGDVQNTVAGSNDGRTGQIPAYFVLNGNVSYAFPYLENASFNVSVKNLLDERYIVSRRPQGIRVGLPRFFSAGLDVKF